MAITDQVHETASTPATRADISRQRGGATGAKASVNLSEKERAISLAAGAIAVVMGISRLSIPGLIVAGIGAGLLNRGATGHCGLYEKLGVDTNENA